MTSDALDWISKISSILGLWSFLVIITFLILCWRKMSYVYRLRDARKKARGQIQSIQDEIQLLRDAHPTIDGVICQTLHNSILDREQRLGILRQAEDSLWMKFSALFRPDPCLRLLEELEQDLRQKVQRMTEARETRLLIQEVYTLVDPRHSAAAPTGDMSTPRDVRNNIRTCEAGAASQPDDTAYHDLSNGLSTGIETGSTGTGTGSLHQRSIYLPPTDDEYDGILRSNTEHLFLSLSKHKKSKLHMTDSSESGPAQNAMMMMSNTEHLFLSLSKRKMSNLHITDSSESDPAQDAMMKMPPSQSPKKSVTVAAPPNDSAQVPPGVEGSFGERLTLGEASYYQNPDFKSEGPMSSQDPP